MKFAKISEDGFFIKDVILKEQPKIVIDGKEVLDKTYISKQCEGLYKPKWEGTNWVEGATEEEINDITSIEHQPTSEDYFIDIDYRLCKLELGL